MNPAESTHVFLVQVNQARSGVTPEASPVDFVPATKEKLLQISELIRESCAGIAEEIFLAPNSPAEIGMEFGVDVGGEAGIPFVTKGTISANFKVSVTWKNNGQER